MSPAYNNDVFSQIPPAVQINTLQRLQAALIEHKNQCAIRLEMLQNKKKLKQMVGN